MADTKIRGVTIELGADVQGITKGLKSVDKELKSTQDELKDINRLLKLDPTNTELLAQKHRALGAAVEQTETKLETLKKAQAQFDAEVKNGGTVNQQQYDALTREIISTEASLKKLEQAAAQSNVALAKVEATAKKIGDTAGKVADKTKKLSTAAAGALAGLAGMAVNSAKAADELNTLSKQSGFSTDDLQKMKYAADLVDVSMEDMTGSISKMRKNMVSGSSDVQAAWSRLGVSVTDSNGALRDSTEVWYEVLAALGQVGNETERDTLAMTLFGKSADSLAGIIDDGGAALKELGAELEATGQILSEEQLTKLNDINDAIDRIKGKAEATLETAGAKAMETLEPVMERIIEKIDKLLTRISEMSVEDIELLGGILLIVAAISPIAGIVEGITKAVGGVTKAIDFLLANPMVALIAAIVLLVTLIATKGDEIQGVLQKVDDFLQNIFAKDFTEQFGVLGNVINFFVSTLEAIFEPIKKIFDGIIDFIRGVFTGDWERAWNGIKEIFEGIVGGFLAPFKIVINAILTVINSLIDGINKMIDGLNKISIDVPDWVPVIGGKKFGFNIGHVGHIPLLGSGGVVQSGSAIVGESGAELLTMTNQGAVVQPLTATLDANSLAALQGGGGSQTVVTVNFTGSLAQLGRILQPQIAAETARIGGSLVR